MLEQYPVTILLIAANAILSILAFSNEQLMNKLILWPYLVTRKNEYHRMITSGFLHADWMHLFFNMFTLFFFGANIEMAFSVLGLGGNFAYLGLYFSALIISDIPSVIKYKNDYHYRALGASGAVSAVVFASIVFDPWSTISLYGAIKIPALIYAVLFIVYCVYMGKKSEDNVNHDAHLWGAVYGLIFTLLLILTLRPEMLPYILEQLKSPRFGMIHF